MARDNLSDILVFFTVARERSFTRAAAKMGMTQSALSHIIRGLETRMGVRLLTRTTRSVSPTEAGERLLQNVAPKLTEIETEIAAISELGNQPAGTIRITAIDHVINNILWPRLRPLLQAYPDLNLEFSSDYRMADIAAERFDIGVRWGDQLEGDMIGVRLTEDMRLLVVGSPGYFERRPLPRSIQDLQKHNCVGLRLASGAVYAWELTHDGRTVEFRPRGQLVFNSVYQMLQAALDGVGLAFVTEDLAAPDLRAGRLVSVIEDWCPHFPGLHAYYPSRRHSSKALQLVIDALRLVR